VTDEAAQVADLRAFAVQALDTVIAFLASCSYPLTHEETFRRSTHAQLLARAVLARAAELKIGGGL
jgi:hypothetical protein